MNINGGKASNVLSGKTARACDSCLLKRARWFCAADDAFLCQSCDAAVHSANQLASRHDRVRLETSSCKVSPAPAWHQGFTKKARTPRHGKSSSKPANHQLPVVPEMSSDDPFPEENDEQLFCRVPVFDGDGEQGFGGMVFDDDGELNLEELLSSCDDEFAADVQSLLGTGMAEADGIDGLMFDEKRVKVEEKLGICDDEIACQLDDAELNWEFDFPSEEVGEADVMVKNEANTLLRLNYEAVIAAWATQGSPWADGIRPNFNLDQFMGACFDEWGGKGGRLMGGDAAGREARVSRYREKRRTRLFSKKIRYEVRKLNAEKRPRMKGRFVKRTTTAPAFLPSSLPYH